MNLDVFLLHNAGLPGHIRNRISHLRALLHVCLCAQDDKPNGNYLDKEIRDVLPLITLELNDLYSWAEQIRQDNYLVDRRS